MAADADLDKTMKDVEKNLEMFERLQEQVADIKKQDEAFEQEFGFTPAQAGDALKKMEMPPEARETYEKEKRRFEEELQQDMAAAEEQFRKEKLSEAAPKKKTVRRRVRNMI